VSPWQLWAPRPFWDPIEVVMGALIPAIHVLGRGNDSAFLKHLKDRGLKGIRLITSDACIGLAESAAEFFPETVWQRCVV